MEKYFSIDKLKDPIYIKKEAPFRKIKECYKKFIEKKDSVFCLIYGEGGIGKTRLWEEFRKDIKKTNPNLEFFIEEFKEENRDTELIPFIHLLYQIFKKRKISLSRKYFVSDIPPMLAPDFIEFTLSSLEEDEITNIYEKVEIDYKKIYQSINGYIKSHINYKPLIIVLENLQWIDKKSAECILHMFSNTSNSPLFIIGTYKGDIYSGGDDNFQLIFSRLKMNKSYNEIKVPNLLAREFPRFIKSMLGEDIELDTNQLTLLYKATKGNPYLLKEFLKGLIENKKIYYGETGWKIDISEETLNFLPKGIEELLIKNYSGLGKHHQSIIKWLSISQSSLTRDDISTLTSIKSPQINYILDDLTEKQYLKEEKGEYFISSYNLKNYFLKNISEEDKEEMNIKLAKIFEKKGAKEKNLIFITEHYYKGKDLKKTLNYALKSGEWLKSQKNLTQALKYYKLALNIAKQIKKNLQNSILLELSDIFYWIGDYKKSLACINEIEQNSPNEKERINCKKLKGIILYGLKRYDNAYKELNNYLKFYDKNDLETLLTLSSLEIYNLNLKKAKEYLNKIENLIEKNKNIREEIINVVKLNKIFLHFYEGDWIKTLEIIKEVEDYFENFPNKIFFIQANIIKNYIKGCSENLTQAINSLKEIENFVEKRNDSYLNFLYLFYTGLLYLHIGDKKSAKDKFEKLYKINKNKYGKEEGYGLVGLSHVFIKENKEVAKKYAEEVLNIGNNYKDRFLIAEAYASLSEIFQRIKKVQQSKKYLDYAKNELEKIDCKWRLNRLYINYGQLYRKIKQFKKALEYLKQGKKYAEIIKDNIYLSEYFYEQGIIFYLNKKKKEALKLYEISKEICEKLDRKLLLEKLQTRIKEVE